MVTFAGGSAVTVDARAKANLKTYLSKLKEAKDDLEHIHKVNEEERERMSSRRQVLLSNLCFWNWDFTGL